MHYRTDAVTGNKLSVLGFGLMRLPNSLPGRIDLATTQKLFERAVEAGVNYFDTAYVYAGSESAFGQILAATGLREKIYIATKLPHGKCNNIEDVEQIFTEQLQRLQTNRIDYYLIHNLSNMKLWRRLEEMGIKEWVAEKKSSGAIGSIGFSFHGSQPDFFEVLDAYDWEFAQIQYNYMNEGYQAGRAGLKAIGAKSIPAIIMEPLLGGRLATGLPKEAAQLFKATHPDKSFASWGFEWLYDQPEVTVVLSGMGALNQLEDNLSTAEHAEVGMLSESDHTLIAHVQESMTSAYKVACTGCNYCMPCPSKVNIPGVFSAYNASYTLGFVTGITQYLTSTAANHSGRYMGVKNCTECGVCEEKCPQHIPIRACIKAAEKRMEPFWFNPLLKLVRIFT